MIAGAILLFDAITLVIAVPMYVNGDHELRGPILMNLASMALIAASLLLRRASK